MDCLEGCREILVDVTLQKAGQHDASSPVNTEGAYFKEQFVVCKVTGVTERGYTVAILKQAAEGILETTGTLKPGSVVIGTVLEEKDNVVRLSQTFFDIHRVFNT